MDYVCSLTGKSPSTTGAGSEGALTKGPFNALARDGRPQQRAGLVAAHRLRGFSSAAGLHRPALPRRPRHQPADPRDLVPAVPARARSRAPDRRRPPGAARGLRVRGQRVLASRLGYRITAKFVHTFFGRVFDNPTAVFTEEILRPETAGPGGLRRRRRTTSWRRSSAWRRPTSRTAASRTLPAAAGAAPHHGARPFEGKDASDPAIRALFTREALLASDWYHERLAIKQQRDIALWERHVAEPRASSSPAPATATRPRRLGIGPRLEHARAELERVQLAGVSAGAGRDDRRRSGASAGAGQARATPRGRVAEGGSVPLSEGRRLLR